MRTNRVRTLWRCWHSSCVAIPRLLLTPSAAADTHRAIHAVYKKPAYGELSGESAHRLLHNHEHFINALSPQLFSGVSVGMTDEKRALLTAIFTRMHLIFKLVLRASPLCDGCVDKLQSNTDGMARDWHKYFIGRALTPKQHMLFMDVPRFVWQHRTVQRGCAWLRSFT